MGGRRWLQRPREDTTRPWPGPEQSSGVAEEEMLPDTVARRSPSLALHMQGTCGDISVVWLWGNRCAHMLLVVLQTVQALRRGIWRHLTELRMHLSSDPAVLIAVYPEGAAPTI